MGRMCIVSKRGRYADKCHVKKLYHSRPEPPAQFPCSSPSSTVSLRNCQALLIPTLLRLRSASEPVSPIRFCSTEPTVLSRPARSGTCWPLRDVARCRSSESGSEERPAAAL